MRGGIPEADRPRAARLVAAAAVLATLAPILWAGIDAARSGWMPVWDNAYPALRAADVFSSHPPLLGTRSSASPFGGRTVSHPGPLEFFLLAPWVRTFGIGAGTALGVAFVNASSVATVIWLVRRRAGPTGAIVASAVLASLTWSVGGTVLFDPWPPHVTLFPFVLALAAAWSVADGDLVASPILALSASFVLQTHLGYAALAPGLIVISLGLLARHRPWGARSWRWLVGAAAVGLVCWSAPIYEQVVRPGGNLRALLETVGSRSTETLSLGEALGVFARTVVLPPWWLPPSFAWATTSTGSVGPPLVPALVATVAFAILVGLAARRAHRTGRRSTASGLILVLGTLPIVVLTLANIPSSELMPIQPGYTRFVWAYAAFAGLLLVLSVLPLDTGDEATTTAARRIRPTATAMCLVAVVSGLLAMTSGDTAHTTGDPGRLSRELAAELVPRLEGDEPVLVRFAPAMSPAAWVGPGLLAELRDAGIPFVVDDRDLVSQLGDHRVVDPRTAARRDLVRVIVMDGTAPPRSAPDAALVAAAHDPEVRVYLVEP